MQAKDLNSLGLNCFFELNVVGSMNENEVDNQINVTLFKNFITSRTKITKKERSTYIQFRW